MASINRIIVVGNSGSGKTTVALAIASALGLPYLEMDSVRHRDGWDSVEGDEFSGIVSRFAQQDRWVIDGNYTSLGTRDVLWPRADTIVWLDLPRWRIMPRVVLRTLRRIVTREVLWDGPREPWTNLYSLDPYRNIVVWAWTRYRHVREKFELAIEEGAWDQATLFRLRTPAEVRAFLAELGDPRHADPLRPEVP